MFQTTPEISLQTATGLRILLVEDEALVRLTTSDMLSDLGFEVEEAADGRSAIDHVRSGATVDILITDIGLPDINGAALAIECRKHLPGLRVIFVSGYDADRIHTSAGDPLYRFLGKPFLTSDLQRMVAELIAQAPAMPATSAMP